MTRLRGEEKGVVIETAGTARSGDWTVWRHVWIQVRTIKARGADTENTALNGMAESGMNKAPHLLWTW